VGRARGLSAERPKNEGRGNVQWFLGNPQKKRRRQEGKMNEGGASNKNETTGTLSFREREGMEEEMG